MDNNNNFGRGLVCTTIISLFLLGSPNTFAQIGPGGVSDGLSVWLRADVGIEAADGGSVLVWEDQSGQNRHAVYNPANGFGEVPPVLDASNPGANDQPTVRFFNVNALEIDLSFLAGSDYTIFVLNGRDRFGLANFYLAGDTALQDRSLVLGYERVDLLRQAHFNRDLDATVEEYVGTQLWSLDAFRFSVDEGKDVYQDGEHLASDDVLVPLLSNTGATLGHFRAFGSLFWFQGDLAEVVIYDRALSLDERLNVEAELAGRYGRPLSLDDYVPCDADWKNKGEYVRNLARAATVFERQGLLTRGERGAAVSRGANSTCGQTQ